MNAPSMSRTQWLICIMASIGFAFDIYELLMLPLIIKPAIAALCTPLVDAAVAAGQSKAEVMPLWAPGGAHYVHWARLLFFIPALAGGVFGLLGGYLTDLFGRRRVLTFSILLYAFSAFASAYATSLPQLLLLRCLVFIGVCVEFVAAVAWLTELFEEPAQREKVLGYTQAFSSVGGFLVAFANQFLAQHADALPAIHGLHAAWRYTLMSGVIPALPLILIRPFLPESPAWKAKRESGQLRRPSITELFAPALRRTTIITTLIFAASYGLAFGAIQQLPQILGAPGKGQPAILKEGLAAKAKMIDAAKASGKPAPTEPALKQAMGNAVDQAVAHVTIWQETGGLVGRLALAALAAVVVGRRTLFRIFQLPSLFIVPGLFFWISHNLANPESLHLIKWGIAAAGFFTVAQFSFWGNYIPRVFPLHLRGTGESFAANIGGRVIGTAAAYITISLSASTPPDPAKMAMVAACVAGAYAIVGALLTSLLPEPKPETD